MLFTRFICLFLCVWLVGFLVVGFFVCLAVAGYSGGGSGVGCFMFGVLVVLLLLLVCLCFLFVCCFVVYLCVFVFVVVLLFCFVLFWFCCCSFGGMVVDSDYIEIVSFQPVNMRTTKLYPQVIHQYTMM